MLYDVCAQDYYDLFRLFYSKLQVVSFIPAGNS